MINIHNDFYLTFEPHIALSPGGSGVLSISDSPSGNEGGFENALGTLDDRVGVVNGTMVENLLVCEVREPVSTPTVHWIRNGEFVSNGVIEQMMDIRSTLNISDFTLADAGEYQCIFIDTDSDAEILTTRPFRLDTGKVAMCHPETYQLCYGRFLCPYIFIDIFAENRNNLGEIVSTIFLNRVSPEVIFLRPPEKLTIEVKASGRYLRLDWTRRASALTMAQNFYNHYEIYFREQTTMGDIGLYEITPFPSSPSDQQIVPLELDFIVLLPGKVHCHVMLLS